MSKTFWFSAISLLLMVFFGIGFALFKLYEEQRNSKNVLLESIQENKKSIDYVSSGMSLDEKRLRAVLQTEKIINHVNPDLKDETVHSLAIIIVDQASRYPSLDHIKICALIAHESRFQLKAKSPVGALGLMQLMPSTADIICSKFFWTCNEETIFDPEKNISMGTYWYNRGLEWNKNNNEVALSEYNGGPGQSARYSLKLRRDAGEVLDSLQIQEIELLPEETNKYPKSVMNLEKQFREKFGFILKNDN
jgi:Transglycosylase SLT domain